MRDGATAVVPDGEPLLAELLRPELRVVTFGGPAAYAYWEQPGREARLGDEVIEVELPFTTGPQLTNSLAALAAAQAAGVRPSGRIEVSFSPLRGQRVPLANGSVVITTATPTRSCAPPSTPRDAHPRRRVAVLGDISARR